MTSPPWRLLLTVAVVFCLWWPVAARCETYGIKDAQGDFAPKVDVTITAKEVVIKKRDPQEKFRSFSIALNSKNRNLIRNVGLIDLEWIDSANKPMKPVSFARPPYNPTTRVFQDSMIKSLGLRLIDKTNRNLFAGKSLPDLFTMQVDDHILLSSEAVTEKDRTVQLGSGRDVSINVDKTSLAFNESNYKKGEIVNVDNRSGLDQVLGVDIPEKGLLYSQIIRKPEQTKINRESWNRFTVASDSGIFIVLIPETDPAQLAQLDGKEIVIKVLQGQKVRETRRIPIKTSSDLRGAGAGQPVREEPAVEPPGRTPKPEPSRTAPSTDTDLVGAGSRPEPSPTGDLTRKDSPKASMWLWILAIVNLVLLGGLACFGIFFMLPKLQVLEDRLAKNEMFIHQSREAIREELEKIKHEILQQCQKDSDSE